MKFIGLCAAALLFSPILFGNEAPPAPKPLEQKDETVETKHSIQINGATLSYTATAGTILLKEDSGKTTASIFYIAYTKDGVDDITQRPVTFCFNGGPGSSAVWLHMGCLGPKRIELNTVGCAALPYRLEDNESTVLETTDLVFIDPVSTGYSRAAPGEDAKKFHGVEGDIRSVGEFIRLYITRNDRWASPKFIAGESYGTTRAAGLVGHLHDKEHMYVNGVILISSVLNFQTLQDFKRTNNDLPFVLFLPSYTAAAWYHKKLPEELQNKPLSEVLADSEHFAETEYSLALLKGDDLSAEEKDRTVQKLAKLTGLPQDYIRRSRMRVDVVHFAKELLRQQERIVGRFDSRILGIDYDLGGDSIEYDPSFDAIIGGFTALFNHYVRKDLKWEKDDSYTVLANVSPWNYGEGGNNQYYNVADTLRDIMTRNQQLRVFIASGYYDLATPYFATDYTVSHLGLDPSLRTHVTVKYYDGGHMMYTTQPGLDALEYDLEAFIKTICVSQEEEKIKETAEKAKAAQELLKRKNSLTKPEDFKKKLDFAFQGIPSENASIPPFLPSTLD